VGGAYCCAPLSKNDDGLLEVCLVKPLSRFRFLQLVDVYKHGGHLADDRFQDIVSYRRGKSVHVKGGKGFGFTLDGEIVEKEDFTIEICPGAIRFVVPAERKKEALPDSEPEALCV
jgi:diacylglycerol kinase (ATP)